MLKPMQMAALSALIVAISGQAFADPIALKETGSTLIAPLFEAWATDYAKQHPDVTITTARTGSGAGIDQAFAGSVQIGTSDAYLSNEQAQEHPDFADIPMAISAVLVSYNVPELQKPLRLDGPVLAGIYHGAIRSWDDKAIAALNPGAALPHHDIVPVHRADGSGDTFVFTQYLSFATTERQDDVGTVIAMPNGSWGDSIGFGTVVEWPNVAGAQEAKGNDGMVDALGKTPYSIGYVGVSFTDQAAAAKLGTAMMRSFSGQFLQPTPATITAAAASLTPRTPADERLTLVNAPGTDCYPLINYEYAVVSRKQASDAAAGALRAFLSWAIAPDEDNAERLKAAHFVALPANIWAKSQAQIEAIK